MAGLNEGQSPGCRHLDKLDFSEKVERAFKDNRPILVRYLRSSECVTHMAGNVEGFDESFRRTVRDRDRNKSMEEANELFLENLEACKDRSKWRTFVNVLQQLEYEMLFKLLTGEPIKHDREKYVKLVVILTPVIKDKIDPLQLIPFLVESDCLNEQDKQNIERETHNHGNIDGTLMLLSRITRLKDDWFGGFMTSLLRNNQVTLMKEIDPDFTAKLCETARLKLENDFSRISIDEESIPSTREKGETETVVKGVTSDNLLTELTSEKPVKKTRCTSPTLSAPKQLEVRDYQAELCEKVTCGKNTAIFTPSKSGKQFILLNIIKNHFKEQSEEIHKVAVVLTTVARTERFFRRCAVFLNHLTATLAADYIYDEDEIKSCNVVVCSFETAVWIKSPLRVVGLPVTLFLVEDPFTFARYAEQMADDDDFRFITAKDVAQVVVTVTRHMLHAEDSFFESVQALALFQIERIAFAKKHLPSLSEQCDLPVLIDKRPMRSRSDNTVGEKIQFLIGQVEEVLKKEQQRLVASHPVSMMSELSCPPPDKMSVLYMAWLKTNSATLRDKARSPDFPALLTMLQILHNTLLINTEARSVDAVQYIVKKLPLYMIPKTLLHKLKGTFTYLERHSWEQDDPVAETIKNKLVDTFQGHNKIHNVVVALGNSIALHHLRNWLKSDELLKDVDIRVVISLKAGLSTWRNPMTNGKRMLLLTTSTLLLNHGDLCGFPWDSIIRTDFPENCLVSWTRGSSGGTEKEVRPIDFVEDFNFEKCLWELEDLQENKADEYKLMLTDLMKVMKQKWLASGDNLPMFEKSTKNFHCHGCGQFLCNEADVRKLDDLWLALDDTILFRAMFISHPNPTVFGKGCGKLARFVCKECGQKWGIISHIFGKSYLALAKDGLDILDERRLQQYCPKWNKTEIDIIPYHYENDGWRCLPSSLCVKGKSLIEIVMDLSSNDRILSPKDRHKTSSIDNSHTPDLKFGYNVSKYADRY